MMTNIVNKQKIYRGPDAVYKLIEEKEEKEIQKIIKQKFNKEMSISEKEKKNDFKNAKSCHICNKKYIKGDALVRYHYYVPGKYRGSANANCNCNLSYRLTHKINVIFHNLSGYDIHFINKDINVWKNRWHS